MIYIRWLGLKVGATVGTLDSGVSLPEILVGVSSQVFEKIMTAQTCLSQTLKATTSIRTDKGTCSCL